MTILSKDCGYYNEEINDEYSPYPGECEDCYRYGICMAVKELDEMTDIEAADILIDVISTIQITRGNAKSVGSIKIIKALMKGREALLERANKQKK